MEITLYKHNKKSDRTQQWTIEIEGNKYRTIEGYSDGAQSITTWKTCVSKNIGKSNETTPEQQALLEAEAKILKKKTERGWVDHVSKIYSEEAQVKIEPMLAHKYEDYGNEMFIYKHIALQPKLDGIRAIGSDQLYSRNGKIFNSSPHILQIINEIKDYLDVPDLIIDGELYNHTYHADFNKLASLIKKSKPKPQDLIESEQKVQYHIFDVIEPDLNFEERHYLSKMFVEAYKKLHPDGDKLVLVETVFMKEPTQEKIDSVYRDWIDKGFEGQMLRRVDVGYINDRTRYLIKRKEYIDDEFEIVDVEEGEGNRSGMAGNVVVRLKDGRTNDANPRGSYEFYIDLLKNKDKYIGKKATIRFQNYTPEGKLRFPRMITIRDYE